MYLYLNKRPIDKTKKSNIKCEHCKFWCTTGLPELCTNPRSPKYNTWTNYWNRCKCFEWKEEDTDGLGQRNCTKIDA